MSLTVSLPKFEGPLGLLLYLIRKEEMNIMDIKIHEITRQYMEYIKIMKDLDLELAGDFVSMASTLIQIKSRMLLPQYNDEGEVIENADPRKELVQKLIEYQKYQEAARLLMDRTILGRDVWPRGIREKWESLAEEIILEENALFSLIGAYQHVLRHVKKKIHQVTAKLQSIASRIVEIRDQLLLGQRIAFSSLITSLNNKRHQVLITFLSLLELGKMGYVALFQLEPYQEIYIETLKPVGLDLISNVEEYEHQESKTLKAAGFDSLSKEDELQKEPDGLKEKTFQVQMSFDFDRDPLIDEPRVDELRREEPPMDEARAEEPPMGEARIEESRALETPLDETSLEDIEDIEEAATDEDILKAEEEIAQASRAKGGDLPFDKKI